MSYSAKTGRFVQAYKFVSVIVLNTILILLVLNFFAGKSLKKRYLAQYKPENYLDRQEIYPGYSPDDIALLMKETWDQPFQYEPWVGFKEKPRTGKFVNINEEGFRNSDKGRTNLSDDGIKIYVFGGSTTFGYGIEDAFTIPAHLQKRISNVYSDKKIRVFNFGRAYYYSTQELALLLQLLRKGYSFDIAIFIDGWNETLQAPYFTDELSLLFDAYNYSPDELQSIVVEQVPLVSYVHEKLGGGNSKKEVFRRSKFRSDPADVRREYLQNREIINLLATKYGFSAYFFIHPAPGYHNQYSNHKFWKQRSSDSLNAMNAKMEALEVTVNNQNAYSMTALLENYSKQPFVDEIHFTPEVCDLIAEFITQKIRIE